MAPEHRAIWDSMIGRNWEAPFAADFQRIDRLFVSVKDKPFPLARAQIVRLSRELCNKYADNPRVLLEVKRGSLERTLMLAIRHGEPIQECKRMFSELCDIGFENAVSMWLLVWNLSNYAAERGDVDFAIELLKETHAELTELQRLCEESVNELRVVLARLEA